MKAVIGNAILFIFLAVCFSSCSGTATSADVPADQTGQPTDSPSKPRSDYPPLPEKIAQGELTNLDNSTTKLADRKGKVVLLNLWATWCGPCRAEMPTLVRLQENYRDAGLEVIGVNGDDESVDLINDFAAEMKLNYTLVWSNGQFQNELLRISKFGGIPQSFLIDRDGNLRGVFKGASPVEIREMERTTIKVVNEAN